ncbi:MAG TPA: O-antigen ligase family protein [Patescibacteria group bacterium]
MTLKKSITSIYLVLFFVTPLIFTSFNSELFELPKMYFVYAAALVILGLHLINVFRRGAPLVRRHFLLIPLSFFLLSQIVSTVFSVDPHTSVFGYYSRLNGGLLSLIAYLILFLILSVYINENFKKLLITSFLASGLIVASFGILEHFGIDKNIWIQDVTSRVFSTLGQPNWLAAYLCVLIPFALYRALTSLNRNYRYGYFALSFVFYLCLLFTKSKSGIIAGIVSLSVFALIAIFKNFRSADFKKHFLPLFITVGIFIVSSLTINSPIKDIFFHSPAPAVDTPAASSEPLNVTPSDQIRKIVWEGSLKLWQKFPLFGTGVETFAYSYYWTRPASHNLTSEWDFLYNKAHNEYLNYLATTGAFGLGTYLFFIIAVLVLITKKIFSSRDLLYPSLLAAYISILITNGIGFSVVIISLFFYLLICLTFDELNFPPRRPLPNLSVAASLLSSVLIIFLLSKVLFFYLADITYSDAVSLDTKNDYHAAYDRIRLSYQYNPLEPVYMSELSTLAAKLALVDASADPAASKKYLNEAIKFSDKAVDISPANVNLLKERAQVFYYLASIDPKYFETAVTTLLKITYLAPTDAKTFYLIGRFLEAAGNSKDALDYYSKAIALKANYDYAYYASGIINYNNKKYTDAKADFENVLKIAPKNSDAKSYLAKINALPASKK